MISPIVNGLADFQRGDVNEDLLRQIFRQAADFELEQNVFQNAAAVFHAGGFAGGFHRHLHGDFFVFGDFMEIHMQHFAVNADGAGFPAPARGAWRGRRFRRTNPRAGFPKRRWWMQVADFARVDFEVLRRGLAAINGGGHAAIGAQLFDFGRGAFACAEMLLMQLISFY